MFLREFSCFVCFDRSFASLVLPVYRMPFKICCKTSLKWKSLSCVWSFATPWTSLSPRNSPGQNTGVGSCSLPQMIFPKWESNQGLLDCRRIFFYQLSYQGSPDKASLVVLNTLNFSLSVKFWFLH